MGILLKFIMSKLNFSKLKRTRGSESDLEGTSAKKQVSISRFFSPVQSRPPNASSTQSHSAAKSASASARPNVQKDSKASGKCIEVHVNAVFIFRRKSSSDSFLGDILFY